MSFDNIKQVTNIEYVGPHQIQTTSSPSINFSSRIEANKKLESFCLLPYQPKDSAKKTKTG